MVRFVIYFCSIATLESQRLQRAAKAVLKSAPLIIINLFLMACKYKEFKLWHVISPTILRKDYDAHNVPFLSRVFIMSPQAWSNVMAAAYKRQKLL